MNIRGIQKLGHRLIWIRFSKKGGTHGGVTRSRVFEWVNKLWITNKERYAKLIFHKILKGVKALHDAGICHRDLKMQNILVDEEFNPKICDFGFASDIKGTDGTGFLKEFLGTLNYAAPEIFLNRPYKGIKADVFSLGVVLLNLVTCKIGFIQAIRKDKYYKNILKKEFGIDYYNDDEIEELFIKISKHKNIPIKGEVDYERVCLLIVNSIKQEKIKEITFDRM